MKRVVDSRIPGFLILALQVTAMETMLKESNERFLGVSSSDELHGLLRLMTQMHQQIANELGFLEKMPRHIPMMDLIALQDKIEGIVSEASVAMTEAILTVSNVMNLRRSVRFQ
jgi:hypothetical protein